MPNYQYRGRGRRGDLIEGALEAATRDAVATQLINSGITPVDIREAAIAFDPIATLRRSLTESRPTLDDLILFCRQMYTLMHAGVAINQAMTGLIRSARNPLFGERLTGIKTYIESGRELSGALAQHPDLFSSLFVNTVRIGENTGRLDEAFLRLSEYLDRERDTRARIKSALRYPSFVIVAITIAIGIINVVVIPQFAKIFERSQVALPLPTRVLIASSDFFSAYWPLLIAGAVAAGLAFRSWIKTESGRYRWDGIKIRLPIVGDVIYRATLGRFARGFSMSLGAGVPLTQALSVMAQAVDNEFIGERIRNIRTGVERGETLTRSATATGMFSPLVLQMLAVGEETGAVDDLLAECAGFYEREVDYDIKNLSQTIEPILIVVLAGFVLIFALGIFLPMWDLASIKLHGGH
ncbi:MAG: type II secretion system F family protein [Gammaproteobacteria bacterium]|nr:type II secretion system F family protein [Gammaproteobacteria bacterium]